MKDTFQLFNSFLKNCLKKKKNERVKKSVSFLKMCLKV